MARSNVSPSDPGPARDVFAFTPHATNRVAHNRGFSVNVAGDVVIRGIDGTADVTLTCVAGVIYPVSIAFMRATGTTATGILIWS